MRDPPSLVSISLPPSHTQHTVLLTISPPTVCPSNDSQATGILDGETALALALEGDGRGRAGCAECVALLRAAGAQ